MQVPISTRERTLYVTLLIFFSPLISAPPSVQTRRKNSPSSSPVASKKDRKGSKPNELTGKIIITSGHEPVYHTSDKHGNTPLLPLVLELDD